MSKHGTYKERYKRIQEENARKEANRKREVRVKELQRKRAGLQSQADVLYTKFNEQKTAIANLDAAIAAETDPATKEQLKNNRAITKVARDSIETQWKTADNRVKEITNKINKLKTKNLFFPTSGRTPGTKGQKTPAGPEVKTSGGKVKFPYKYNAPLVRNAYFNPTSITSKSLDTLSINYSAYQTAQDAWKNAKPAKGAIQMDREVVADQLKAFDRKRSNVKPDPQLYGFRFLYNPKEVSMGWQTQAQVDPQFIAKDETLPVSSGLTAASVSFTLILNRIEDMNYIDENGLTSQFKKRSENVSGTLFDVDPGQRNLAQQASLLDRFPYPDAVSAEDLKEIYKKGTMYDLEYFFRVIHGPAGRFTNKFDIKTADWAYLRLALLELHLGDSMRYRIIIDSIDVNHTIFNDRMVPLFSTVRLTCRRLLDYPNQDNVGVLQPGTTTFKQG